MSIAANIIVGYDGTAVTIFFLSCILIAGIYGAITANRKILFIQALPAAIGIGLILLTN